ncbi:uncharacterized protein LOC130014852 [Mercurialis annua]|uniref:uncharacterized protein LOC130014852 n=1 Tax=Mercurialis annua TaxID=3986 RepID=UPI0024ADED8E|nr:uncharacterized protein LOC130014852 [Mercurialis annua]
MANPRAIRFLRDMARRLNPSFLFLCETMISGVRIEVLKNTMGFDYCVAVDSVGKKGGLAFFWKAEYDVEISSSCDNYIDLLIKGVDGQSWRLTGFYGYPERWRRRDSWNLIHNLSQENSAPWCVIGDFNDLLSHEEKRGGAAHPNWLVNGFRDTILASGLLEMEATGYKFTWSRGRKDAGKVEELLDRAFVTSDWIDLFPEAKVVNQEMSTSDHLPVLLYLNRSDVGAVSKKFRFNNVWVTKKDCVDVVSEAWRRTADGDLCSKLKETEVSLKGWGGSLGPNYKRKLEMLRKKLAVWQRRTDQWGMHEFNRLSNEYHTLLGEEEIFWKQRAKNFWLSEGDANTRFFHNFASTRKRKNRVDKLKDDFGVWQSSKHGMAEIILRYFSNLFTDSQTGNIDFIDILPRVSNADNVDLMRPISELEVRRAVYSMHNDKSPGPDGFNPAFYKSYWNVVGGDIVKLCRDFFVRGSFREGLNDTEIVLIPKISRPETITDFRPIALCNVAYKIIAKVMANRMKKLMPKIISENQSAFVENRLITDNFLIAFEIGHYLRCKRRGKNGLAALKIDMSKAYDRVRWVFVEFMCRKLGFCDAWISLIMHCISSVRYTGIGDCVGMNPIIPSRGLRQGDPLSPYLFILCAEGLSLMLAQAEREGKIHGAIICRGAPPISHLFFADDCFLFFRATPSEMKVVKDVLDDYENWSGQKVNFNKSNIIFSPNVPSDYREEIRLVMGIVEVGDSGKYLGLPSLVGRNKSHIFGFIKEKVWNKVKGWNSKFLSRGGKEVLIKTVAQSMPNYVMNVFLIPLRLCEELERMLNSFWWGRDQAKKKGISWARWDKLCVPKKFGGMGFKKIRDFNLAMLARQAWRFISVESNLMVKVFKAKYFPNSSFFDSKLGSNPSYVWRSIFETKKFMKKGARVRIGNGSKTDIWGSPWLNGDVGYVTTPRPDNLINAKVSNLLDMDGQSWDVGLVRDVFNDNDAENILSIPISCRRLEDGWRWNFEPKGNFSVKSCYRVINGEYGGEVNPVWNKIWRLSVPLHVRNFIWRASSGYLPTAKSLATRHVFINDQCVVCSAGVECEYHLFYKCSLATACWSGLSVPMFVENGNFLAWVSDWLEGPDVEKQSLIAIICWLLWQNRNNTVWNKKGGTSDTILINAGIQLSAWKVSRSQVGQLKRAELHEDDGRVRWSPPKIGWLKVNVDAAVFSRNEGIGVGIVVRDWRGSLVQARLVKFHGNYSPRVAEAMGIREALSWLKDSSNIIIESDAMEVILAIRNPSLIESDFLIDDCLNLAKQLCNVSFVFVRRSANQAAHCLAQNARSLSGHQEWFSNFPDILTNVTAFD